MTAAAHALAVSIAPSTGEPDLDRVTLRIEAGSRVIVVGPADEGKAALAMGVTELA
ncbi:MAG: hypothetical protein OXN89_03980 [Bryobacterales bacterium]|nr:hypothetical protein [Bryobacterales bacterium]